MEIKIIIRQQITRNLSIKIIKVSLLVYINNLFEEKNLINSNILIILIKNSLFLKINKLDNYNKTNLVDY